MKLCNIAHHNHAWHSMFETFSSNRFMFLINMYCTMRKFSTMNLNKVTYFNLMESIKMCPIVFM